MNQPETLKTEEIYRGRIFEVSLATVREEEKTYTREIISHPGSAVIVPVFADETVALVRQYRHPARKYLLEIPAGSLAPGEDPQAGAERELEEEIGTACDSLDLLAEFYPSPGFLAEKMWVYLATKLRATAQRLEEDEFVEIVRFSVEEAMEMIRRGEIMDAKTIIALYALIHRNRES